MTSTETTLAMELNYRAACALEKAIETAVKQLEHDLITADKLTNSDMQTGEARLYFEGECKLIREAIGQVKDHLAIIRATKWARVVSDD